MDPNAPLQPQQPLPPVPVQPSVPATAVPQPAIQAPLPAMPQTAEMFGSEHKVAAFMNPSNPTTPPPRRSHKKAFVIVVVLILLLAAAAVGFALTREKPATPEPKPNDVPAVVEEQPQQSGGRGLADDITLSSAPSFAIPELDGWSKDDTNANLNGIEHSGGCKATFTQLTERTNIEMSDADATDKVFANLIADLEQTATVSEIQYGTANVATSDKTKAVEFKTITFKYSTDLSEARSTVTARSIDGYVMGVRFFCQTPAFSDTLNQGIITNLSISIGEQS